MNIKQITSSISKEELEKALSDYFMDKRGRNKLVHLSKLANTHLLTESELVALIKKNDLGKYITIFKEWNLSIIEENAVVKNNGTVMSKFLGSKHQIDGNANIENPLTVLINNDLQIEHFIQMLKKDKLIDSKTFDKYQERANIYKVDSGNRYRKKLLGEI